MEERRQQTVLQEQDKQILQLWTYQSPKRQGSYLNTENVTALKIPTDGHAWEGLISEERLLPLWEITRCNPSTREL